MKVVGIFFVAGGLAALMGHLVQDSSTAVFIGYCIGVVAMSLVYWMKARS